MDPLPNPGVIHAGDEAESDQDVVERVDVKLRVEDLELVEVLHRKPKSIICFVSDCEACIRTITWFSCTDRHCIPCMMQRGVESSMAAC
jgi:hypothetical protein